MANIREKAAVNHFKKNDDLDIDYVVIVKHDLKGEIVKGLKEVQYDKENTLKAIIGALEERISKLELDNEELHNLINDLNTKFDDLNSVFENTIKELISR